MTNEQIDKCKHLIECLKCCSEAMCNKCPRCIYEDENEINYYSGLCNMTLELETARFLEELTQSIKED